MRRLSNLPIGTKVEVEDMWEDDRLPGVVAEPPEWALMPGGRLRDPSFIPVYTEHEGRVKLYAAYYVFVEEKA